jgi:hypothetical protein
MQRVNTEFCPLNGNVVVGIESQRGPVQEVALAVTIK